MSQQLVDFDGKDVLVIGGATGMGAATARRLGELGARVTVMDVVDVSYSVAQHIPVDLRSKASVVEALKEVHVPLAAVFACAGVADGTAGIVQINFIGQRYLVECLSARGLLPAGSAIVMISSVAGLPWQRNMAQLMEFLGCDRWEDAEQWLASHEGNNTYGFSKQAINAYVASAAMQLLKSGVRLNAVLPGPTNTPLARANADAWLGFGEGYRKAVGLDCLESEQIASVMLFLASSAASGINGCTLLVDQGHISAAMSGVYEEPVFAALMG